jgi:hypothetical protein
MKPLTKTWHERTGPTRKVRALKHRRSRSLQPMTPDHHGKHKRREKAWRKEQRSHKGPSVAMADRWASGPNLQSNHPRTEEGQRVREAVNGVLYVDGVQVAAVTSIDFAQIESRILASMPTPEAFECDPHSAFFDIERRL